MNKCLIIFILLFASYASAAEQEPYELFKRGLAEQVQNIKSSLAFYETPALYTKQAIEHNLLIVENAELRTAGRNLVAYLQDQHGTYYDLPFEQWLSISEELLELDAWLGNYSAWGNFVVKINICNKILYRIFDYLENHPESLDSEKYTQLLTLQIKLRKHLPSNFALYEIAFRHYGKLKKRTIRSFEFDPKLQDEYDAFEAKLRSYFNNEEDFSASLLKYYELEKRVPIDDYLAVWDHPLPFHSARFTNYLEQAWKIYLYTRLLQKAELEEVEWVVLNDDVINSALKEEQANENGFWVSRYFHVYEKKTAAVLERVRSKKFLERVQNSYKRAQIRQDPTNNIHRQYKRFSPHSMP